MGKRVVIVDDAVVMRKAIVRENRDSRIAPQNDDARVVQTRDITPYDLILQEIDLLSPAATQGVPTSSGALQK